jgi:UDPglucose--hexose-1-phosphate uridylyltransferase
MIEMRQDPTTRTWVLVGQTGDDLHSRLALAPEHCPFCPGREADTAPAVATLPGPNGGWRVRAFPDRLPVFQLEGQLDPRGDGIYDRMRNIGAHEVVVETPRHDTTLAACADADVAAVLRIFRGRIRDLKRDARLRYVQVYKNQGRQAGEHIPHAHSHVLATPILPRRLEMELRWSKHYYEKKERCLYCDMLRQEQEAGARLVEQSADAVSFCPFAPRAPFETWLVPTAHSHRFEDADDALLDRLAPLLRRTLWRIEHLASSYHLTLHTGPNEQAPAVWGRPWASLTDDFHWHIEVLPRPEGGGRLPREEEFILTPVLPEDAARRLRQIPAS